MKAALMLVEDNQERARRIGELHREVITATRVEIWQGVPTSYEPGGREADFFMKAGGEMTRHAVAQLALIRKILKKESSSADSQVASAAALVGRIADAHEEYLAKAVESAALHLSFERMGEEMGALDEIYKALLALAPSWTTAFVGKSEHLGQYEAEIAAGAGRVTLDTRPGRSGPTGLPGQAPGVAATMSNDEYQARKQALEDKKAAEKRYYDKRMAELAEHEKQKAAAEQARLEQERKAASAPPPPPPELAILQAWHTSFYTARIVPFKQALGGVLRLPDRSHRTSEACAQMTVATRNLLADPRLASGTPAVDQTLRAALQSFSQAGQACMEGRMGELQSGLAAGEAALARFAAALGPYQLRP